MRFKSESHIFSNEMLWRLALVHVGLVNVASARGLDSLNRRDRTWPLLELITDHLMLAGQAIKGESHFLQLAEGGGIRECTAFHEVVLSIATTAAALASLNRFFAKAACAHLVLHYYCPNCLLLAAHPEAFRPTRTALLSPCRCSEGRRVSESVIVVAFVDLLVLAFLLDKHKVAVVQLRHLDDKVLFALLLLALSSFVLLVVNKVVGAARIRASGEGRRRCKALGKVVLPAC